MGGAAKPRTVRDLHSRFVLAVVLLPKPSAAAARQALRRVFRRYGLPEVIRVDNGAPFGGKGALGLSRLSVWWLRLGIAVELTRPAHPQDNGGHEQMHRGLKADTAAPPAPSLRAQRRRTAAWITSYNQERPHEALGQQVPAHFYRPSRRRLPLQLKGAQSPQAWPKRRVRNRGQIKWEGRQRFVGRAFVGELVGLKRMSDGSHEIYLKRHLKRVALPGGSGRYATGLCRTSTLKLRACPPQVASAMDCRLRSGSLRSPALRRQPIARASHMQKCHPCHENKVLPMS